MFGIKSARRRALLASVVMLVLLGTVGGVAAWRTHSDGSTLDRVDKRLAIVTDLDNARSYTLLSATQLAAALLANDSSSLEKTFTDADLVVEESLRNARTNLAATGNDIEAARLDTVIAQIDEWQSKTGGFLAMGDATSQQERLQMGQQYIPALWPQFRDTMEQLARLSESQ
ncbi:MAG: hypothetical protein MUP15_03070, partial [Dehalococcoidia bacterium]|nr:hypothetical protein [Dehalococcoidia bacterium]